MIIIIIIIIIIIRNDNWVVKGVQSLVTKQIYRLKHERNTFLAHQIGISVVFYMWDNSISSISHTLTYLWER